MTLQYLLDTSIVLAPMAKTPDPHIIKRLERHGHESAIGAPVWHELTYGCRRLPRGKGRDALESYLHDVVQALFPILPYDETAATWHGYERARLEGLGQSPPFVDGQIAAIAHANRLALITANVRHFTHFAELQVGDWSKRRGRA